MRLLIKILSFLSGCFIICIIAMSSNSQWFDKSISHIASPYRYGGLFAYSSMPGFKIPLNSMKISTPDKIQNENIELTIIGDSYMQGFDSTSFCAKQYHFIHWNNIPDTIPLLDNKKTNILIIETIERYCRWRLKNNNPIFIGEQKNKKTEVAEIKLSAEDNLQYFITYQDWAFPFKELKTIIYLNFFDRFDNRVAKPNGDGRLYLEETINPEKNSSCYNPVGETEINDLVNSINAMYENAQKAGFQKVYLSIIPNAASLYHVSDLPYNRVIERIQENSNFKIPCIDAYHILKKQTNSVFYSNDDHWNNFGKIVWLTKVNAILKEKL